MKKTWLKKAAVSFAFLLCVMTVIVNMPQKAKAENNNIVIQVVGNVIDNAEYASEYKVEYSEDNGNTWITINGQAGLDRNINSVLLRVAYNENKVMVQDSFQAISSDGVIGNNVVYTLSEKKLYEIQIDKIVRSVTWAYNDDRYGEDGNVKNGTVEIVSAIKAGNTDRWSGIEVSDFPGENNNKQDDRGGRVVIVPGSTVTVKLVPDYGYQFVSGSLNGNVVTATDEVSTFTFIMPDTNLHLSAVFTKSDDKAVVNSKNVSKVSVEGGADVISSGNLKLTVDDSKINDNKKNELASSVAATDVEVTQWLEIGLEQVINKGNDTDFWSEKLEELNKKVIITLNVGTELDDTVKYVVIREHNGVYEQLEAAYNKELGTLTFQSDKFSEYAIGTVRDTNTPGESGGSDNEDKDNNKENTDNPGNDADLEETSPETADVNMFYIWTFATLMISSAGVLYILDKKYIKNEN